MIPRLTSAIALLALFLTPATAQDTLLFSHGDYTAELPADPQRVFVMDSRTGLDFAVSAGFPIVATDWDEDVGSHFADDIPAEADRLTFRNEPNAELVLSYEPDLLVVGAGWWRFWQEQAMFRTGDTPILVVADGNGRQWRELFAEQMAAIGKAERAGELLAAYDAAVAEAKPRIAAVLDGRAIAIADIWGDQLALHVDTFSTAVAEDLGIVLVAGDDTAPTSDGYKLYSPENLGVLEDAAIVMSLWTEDISDNPLWQRVPAVAAGRQYEMDIANSWGFALTATDLVGDIVKAVALLDAPAQ